MYKIDLTLFGAILLISEYQCAVKTQKYKVSNLSPCIDVNKITKYMYMYLSTVKSACGEEVNIIDINI